MSRSIHKTIKQISQVNSKADLNDPENEGLVEYGKKRRYKKEENQTRQNRKAEEKLKQNKRID